jgi:hypothetical protein
VVFFKLCENLTLKLCYNVEQSGYPTKYKLILRPMIGRIFDNLYEMEEYLFNEAKDIDFTIVRPPRLSDDSLSSKKY